MNTLKRKVSLRDGYARQLKEKGIRYQWRSNGKLSRRKPLKKVSASRRNRERQYMAVREEFLSQPENRNCQACQIRREAGENIPLQPSVEIHHSRGRIGSLLMDTRFFLGVCQPCHSWIHAHPKQARELRLLSDAPLWNVPQK